MIIHNYKTRIIWSVHLLFVIFAIGMFFVPEALWPQKVRIHFFIVIGMLLSQIIAGLYYLPKVGKFYFACPLNNLEDHYGGREIHKHLGRSSIGQFCKDYLGLPYWLGTVITILILIGVTLQYFNII
ncbi:MAG: DUF2784 family protein [Nanoarchaeota archaeon]